MSYAIIRNAKYKKRKFKKEYLDIMKEEIKTIPIKNIDKEKSYLNYSLKRYSIYL